ncbi:MAG: hypothetical protein JNN33_13545 [Rhodospirillaceae bacterium]|nr:hypothetical protein [Rhodospirillaceae bacterium]
MSPPFQPGQFVWCRFPFFEAPLSPGEKERIVYVADIRQHPARRVLTVMSLYTTTRTWDADAARPLGIIPVDAAAAARMNQKPFVIDARRIAFVPLDEAFFPRLRTPDAAIVSTAPPAFRRQVENALARLAGRADLVQQLGPDMPGRRR